MVGELITQGIIIIEKFYNCNSLITKDAPTKFLTRLRKYRILYGPVFEEIISSFREIVIEPIKIAENKSCSSSLEEGVNQNVESLECIPQVIKFPNRLSEDYYNDNILSDSSFSPFIVHNKINLLGEFHNQKDLISMLLNTYNLSKITIFTIESIAKRLLIAASFIILVWHLYKRYNAKDSISQYTLVKIERNASKYIKKSLSTNLHLGTKYVDCDMNLILFGI